MRLSRKQLRKLINEIRVKPGGDMDPEYSEKLTGLVDTGDEAFITQADELAPLVGYAGDSFSKDLKAYDQVSIMGAVGEFAHYLTDDLMQKLMNVRGKDLRYGLYSWAGFGFAFADGGDAISPDDFYEIQYRIAAKKRDIDDDDIAKHEGMSSSVAAAHKLAQAVMLLSRKTTVSRHTIEDAGIGETYDGVTINFYNLSYKAMHKAGKLVIV